MNNQEQNSADKAAPQIELLPPSMTLRVGNRRLTMSWRPRKQLPHLLNGLLRRSWRAMFGSSLRMSATAVAICAAWNVPAMAAAPDVNTLPTGGTVTYGNATFSQTGNTLNINQTTGQAIANFTTFSIGANAVVNVNQPSAAAAFLARVTGSDPSLIYGLLKSNGTVALINQNGILVGPTGVVDVARFIASTLRISDSDFLAGRLNFSNGSLAGNVENQGTIKTLSGGSVYLIGANVSNSGVITSPNGEILLVAGQTVQLVDTGTPGVTVNVTGTTGKVTNLGSITAEAGRIGIAAGLINNSGNINASSVVSDGGRIFLRASQNLTTTATSKITADGATKGGSVVLYSDKVAYLDGDISATGATGQGGYVETSGKQSLDVVKLPSVGSGGEWYIDPYDLEVVSDSFSTNNATGTNVISSAGDSSKIRASTIVGMLNAGTDVTLTTGNSGGSDAGNITVNADINKVGVTGSTLTMNAENNITINANITSSGSALNLTLNSYYRGDGGGSHDANVNHADISLNGGVLNVTNGNSTVTANSGHGGLNLNSGSRLLLTQAGSQLNAGAVTVDGTSSLLISHGSASLSSFTNSGITNITDSGTLAVTGDVNNNNMLNLSGSGTIDIGGSINNTDTGILNVNATSLHFARANSVNTSGSFNVLGGTVGISGGNVSGNVNVSSGAALTLNFLNVGNASHGTTFGGTGSMTWTGNITLLSNIALAAGGPSLTFDGRTTAFVLTGATESLAINFNTSNNVTLKGNGSLDPRMVWNNSGKIDILANNLGDQISIGNKGELNNLNGGVINISGPTSLLGVAGAFTNDVGATVNLATCSTLNVGAGEKLFTNNGNITTSAVSWVTAGTFVNAGNISGAGTLTASNAFTNNQGAVLNMTGGSLNTGDTVNNLGTLILSNAAITATNGVNNDGAISIIGAGNHVTINGDVLNNQSGTVLVSGSDASLATGQFTNGGSLTLGSGSSVTGTNFINSGTTTLNGSGLSYSSVANNEGGNISGTGSIIAGNGFTNNGVLSPGGDGSVGMLSVIGDFTQGSTGVLNIDIGGATNYDVLNVVSQNTVQLGGTLKTKLTGGYVPALLVNAGPSFSPITTTGSFSGYFRHVLGDVINAGSGLQMIKANYGSGLTLGMAGSENITYSTAGEGQWGSLNSWSTGYIPTAIDNISVDSGTLTHGTQDGVDIVNNITIGSGGTLSLYGGKLNTTNLVSVGAVNIGQVEGPGGALTVSGIAQMNSLSLTGLGYFLNGTTSSTINVNGNFVQTNMGVINSSGNVTLSQTSGDLIVGNITASNLTLTAAGGAISQTNALHVTRQLTTLSSTGTTLDYGNPGFSGFAVTDGGGGTETPPGGNQIAAYTGSNTVSGDIVLVNNLNTTDTSRVLLNGISNAGGNIYVDNTGGMATSSQIKAVGGGVALLTHSPLTIGSGGVTASGGISLGAGAPDNLVINGAITSTGGGAISLAAGGSISVNANIFTQGLYSGTPNPVYAAGVSVTDINGTTIPVAQIIQQIISPAIAQSIAPASSTVVTSVTTTQAVNNTVVPTTPTSTPNPVTSSTTLTTGGEPGSFGGSDTADSSSGKGTSGPASAKTTKMYCN